MFMVGTYILEKYSDSSFEDFLQDHIFIPLGMNSTTTSPVKAGSKKSQAWSATGRRIPFWFTEKGVKVVGGAGAIISSSKDMVCPRYLRTHNTNDSVQTKWAAMMLNEGVDPVSNTTIIPMAAYKIITTASSVVFGAGKDKLTTIVGYGMGWRRTAYRGNEVNMHLLCW